MWVVKQMGHSDWTMIARVYGRWMPSADAAAGSKAECLWSNEPKQENLAKYLFARFSCELSYS